MISGTVVLEDGAITFNVDNGSAIYKIAKCDVGEETKACSSSAFLKALAIAIHPNGEPDYTADYNDAESAQPANVELRFIP